MCKTRAATAPTKLQVQFEFGRRARDRGASRGHGRGRIRSASGIRIGRDRGSGPHHLDFSLHPAIFMIFILHMHQKDHAWRAPRAPAPRGGLLPSGRAPRSRGCATTCGRRPTQSGRCPQHASAAAGSRAGVRQLSLIHRSGSASSGGTPSLCAFVPSAAGLAQFQHVREPGPPCRHASARGGIAFSGWRNTFSLALNASRPSTAIGVAPAPPPRP